MSRRIDPHSVLTEDEVQYLTARGQFNVLAENAAYLITTVTPESASDGSEGGEEANPPEDTGSPVSDDSSDETASVLTAVVPVEYGKLTRAELEAEFNARNSERPDNGLPLLEFSSKYDKNELTAFLLADDALVASRK